MPQEIISSDSDNNTPILTKNNNSNNFNLNSDKMEIDEKPASNGINKYEGAIDVSTAQDGGILKKILREGSGEEYPSKGSKVHVHYVGRLLDGSVFDSSRDRKEEFTFTLGQGAVIKGWDQGVATMRKGEMALLVCKPDYAYGSTGAGEKIPPNSTLEFEVELLRWDDGEDLTGDGGVMKKVVTEGSGWKKPKDGEDALIDVRGFLADESKTQFLKLEKIVYTIGKTAKGELSSDHLIPYGVSKALSGMKKGEVAKVQLLPEYGYGEEGNAKLHVPASSSVWFEITLHSWLEVTNVSNDNGIVKITIESDSHEYSSPKDGAKVVVRVGSIPEGVEMPDIIAQGESGVAGCIQHELVLGDGTGVIPDALESAIETMKKNERAVVKVRSDYLTDSSSTTTTTATSTTTSFEVKLISFTNPKDSWEMKPEEKLTDCNQAKEKGSELFRKSKYRLAEKKYNKAMKLVELDTAFNEEQKVEAAKLRNLLHLNLAAVQLKLNKWSDVIKSCDKYLEKEPNSAKALFRRAQAHHKLQDFEKAKADLNLALQSEPDDKAIKNTLAVVQAEIQRQHAKEKKIFGNLFEKLSKMEEKEKQGSTTASAPTSSDNIKAGDEGVAPMEI